MRIPKNIIYTNDNSIIEETIHIEDYEKIDYPYLNLSDVNDKFIKRVEKVVRNSIEYREYIKYLKDELDLNICSLLTNLDYDSVEIHMHHGPLTLYDIADIVIRKLLTNNSDITLLDIAEEITLLHYQNKVGLIPLSVTIHELIHTGDIFIPVSYFYGNWKEFYTEYKDYFTTDQINLLEHYIEVSKEVIKDMSIPEILQRKYTYITVDGLELPKSIELVQKKEKGI